MTIDLLAECERVKFLDWISNNKDMIINYLILEEEALLLELYNIEKSIE